MQTLENLQYTHPAYTDHTQNAEYLYRSYIGGDLYRAGDYLTRYFGEDSDGHSNLYTKRLNSTPLNNYVKTTIDIYRSFLFRELPHRNLGTLSKNPLVSEWVNDTDNDGQNMDSFLKTMNDYAMIMGNMWILVDKPSYAVETMAQEIQMGIRPYACMYSPSAVMDWEYRRNIAGKKVLEYIKVVEENTSYSTTISMWYPDYIERYTVSKDETTGAMETITEYNEYVNPLGYIPFINHAPIPTPTKGMGYSLVEDVADTQKYIYNMLSELEQTVRISGHPTLVKTSATNATAGAGSIVTMPEDLDPGLTPFLLQPTGATIGGILDTIDKQVESIQKTTHTSAVQGTKGSPMSGVALQTERQLLNAKLSDLADTLEETEKKMWNMWSNWTGIELPPEFSIDYVDTFDIRDQHSELELLTRAADNVPHDIFKHYIHDSIVNLLVEDPAQATDIKKIIAEEHAAMPMAMPAETTQESDE